MFPFLQRSELVVGMPALERLQRAHVLVVGAGGVGSYAIEALCRGGVGALTIVDGDVISQSNINRQLYALHSTLGRPKAELAAQRCADINPDIQVRAVCAMYGPDSADSIFDRPYVYVLDAIDSVTAKIDLIARAHALGTPIISALGTGNKLRPELLTVTTLGETSGCPLARVLRRELSRRELAHTRVVYSPERPVRAGAAGRTPGSVSFVPPCAGMIMAGVAMRDMMAE